MLLLLISVFACGKKKKIISLTGDEKVEVNDFISFFPEVQPPFILSDSIFKKKNIDSLRISYPIFTQFAPDSILVPVFGKEKKISLYPLGRISVKNAESYLIAKASAGTKQTVYLFAFDRKQAYVAGLNLLKLPLKSGITNSLSIDRRYNITRTMIRKNRDGSMNEGKEVFVLNEAAKEFTLILTEALEDKITELINPIDTLSRKHKYAADYGNGTMNLVSVRDGRKPDRVSFFVHFEKNNGECTGELKGEAMLRSANTAEYKVDGDPCILKFIFSSSSVTLKEESCGSRRGMKCSFDGSFQKKKQPKSKITTTKS